MAYFLRVRLLLYGVVVGDSIAFAIDCGLSVFVVGAGAINADAEMTSDLNRYDLFSHGNEPSEVERLRNNISTATIMRNVQRAFESAGDSAFIAARREDTKQGQGVYSSSVKIHNFGKRTLIGIFVGYADEDSRDKSSTKLFGWLKSW